MTNSSICIRISILWSRLSSFCCWQVSVSIFWRLISRLCLSNRWCLSRCRRSIIVACIAIKLRVNIAYLIIWGPNTASSLSNNTAISLYLNWSCWSLPFDWLPVICYYWFLLFWYIIVVCHIRVLIYKIIIKYKIKF